jgi:hypothetical protein
MAAALILTIPVLPSGVSSVFARWPILPISRSGGAKSGAVPGLHPFRGVSLDHTFTGHDPYVAVSVEGVNPIVSHKVP